MMLSIPARRAGWALAACSLAVALVSPAPASADGGKPLTFVDLMKLRSIEAPVIADGGGWLAYALVPDRGDGEVVVRATAGDTEYRIARGSAPAISTDGRWVAALVEPPLEEREKAEDSEDEDQPKTGLALLATADGTLTTVERVASFAFSEDGRWLAYERFADPEEEDQTEDGEAAAGTEPEPAAAEAPAGGEAAPSAETPPEGEKEETPGAAEASKPDQEDGEKKDERLGKPLVLRALAGGSEIEIAHVAGYGFDDAGRHLAYAVAAPAGEGNGLFVRRLDAAETTVVTVTAETRGRYTHLTWPRPGDGSGASRLAFVATVDDDDGQPGDGTVWLFDGDPEGGNGGARPLVGAAALDAAWFIPAANDLAWSRDGARLFFGTKPRDEKVEKKDAKGKKGAGDEGGEGGEGDQGEEAPPFDPYDVEALLAKRGVDVWHWNDPLINPNQKKAWEEGEKDRTYRAVVHLESGAVVQLADRTMRQVAAVDNPHASLGLADVPYLQARTWEGFFADLYRVDLTTGARQTVAERLADEPAPSLSPDGRFVVFYRRGHWHLFDGSSGETRNLTAGLEVPFADEDHDYPMPAPGYGVAGWVEGDAAVLLYDKYDLWRFATAGGDAVNLTAGAGRREQRIFRLLDLHPERRYLTAGEPLLLSAYHDRLKTTGFYRAHEDRAGVARLLEDEARTYALVAKARRADTLLITRERYHEFPDLWTADLDLGNRRRRSDANPEIADYAWGRAELVTWLSDDGEPLEGVLIKPGNYVEGERYPVLVYYYRFFSPRLHRFNQLAVNHRPSFPVYASHGYAIFLPDIRFEVGRPGLSAIKCLVPGVHKLIAMGIADPDAVGLHGHSWSGYQTAFAVTQTNLFAAAVAGAPVSNMTSAYSGIRWGSGLARQFQYEQSQSRLGVSLWQGRDRYIDNSPVFFADRIETPLLIQFGDQDEAVPWYQGIELYLALRRLGKEAVFLQYRDEPHHLKQYPNKLDYSIKMKAFFDHYLQGAPAPDWWRDGVPYRGK